MRFKKLGRKYIPPIAPQIQIHRSPYLENTDIFLFFFFSFRINKASFVCLLCLAVSISLTPETPGSLKAMYQALGVRLLSLPPAPAQQRGAR